MVDSIGCIKVQLACWGHGGQGEQAQRVKVMGEGRLYKRLRSTPSKTVRDEMGRYQGRKGYQHKRNLARQAIENGQRQLIKQRLAKRRFGLARPAGPPF